MLRLRITSPADRTDHALAALEADGAVSSVSVLRGASVQPPGDLIFADVAREGANDVVESLRALHLQPEGTLQIDPVTTWVSKAGYEAEQRTPGSGADSVVWIEVIKGAYDDTELNWTFLSFISMATMLAAIAIVIDSQILTIGAMVLGPEFGAVAALGVALVRRRFRLLRRAAVTLVVGFGLAIAATTVVTLCGKAIGWVTLDDVTGPRPETEFIYYPDHWSLVVAVIAGAAGVLSLTSSKTGGLSGVFISVTTVPAAGNVALGLAFGVGTEIWGSTLQLGVNLVGMAIAGWLTLVLQQTIWSRVSARRAKFLGRIAKRDSMW